MKKNKGFTMIELLTVIVLLSIIATITYVSIGSSMNNSKERLYREQINNLEKAGHNWITKNNGIVDDSFDNNGNCKANALYCDNLGTNSYYKLSFDQLSRDGFIESSEVKNPKNGQLLPGCIGIRYDYSINRYDVKYLEMCSSLTSTSAPTELGSQYLGVIKVVYMDPTEPLKKCTAAMAAANVNANGTPTEIKDGCMKWYIYKEENGYYKMILDHNTTARLFFNDDYETYEEVYSDIIAKLKEDTKNWAISNNSREDLTKIKDVSIISLDEVKVITNKTDVNIKDVNWFFYLDGSGTNYHEIPTYSDSVTSPYAWLYNNTYLCKSDDTNYGCTIEDEYVNYPVYELTNTATNTFTKVGEDHETYGYFIKSSFTESIDDHLSIGRSGVVGSTISEGMTSYSGIRPVVTIPTSWVK